MHDWKFGQDIGKQFPKMARRYIEPLPGVRYGNENAVSTVRLLGRAMRTNVDKLNSRDKDGPARSCNPE